MLTTTDAATLYACVTMQLGDSDTPVWEALSEAKKAKYDAAVEALADIDEPLDRAATLHEQIGSLWDAPAWDDMQGPERAAFLFAAGSRATD